MHQKFVGQSINANRNSLQPIFEKRSFHFTDFKSGPANKSVSQKHSLYQS